MQVGGEQDELGEKFGGVGKEEWVDVAEGLWKDFYAFKAELLPSKQEHKVHPWHRVMKPILVTVIESKMHTSFNAQRREAAWLQLSLRPSMQLQWPAKNLLTYYDPW